MSFEEEISFIFLKYLNEIIDLEFYIDGIIDLILGQSKEEETFWKSITDSIINKQNSLLSKIVHIYSITIFETFNKELFERINTQTKLKDPNVTLTPSKIVLFFKNNFNVDFKQDFPRWNGLKENICRRHIIVHNMGVIDEKYVRCISANTNLIGKVIGKDIPHDLAYVKNSNDNVALFMRLAFKKVINYYSLKNIYIIVKELTNERFHDVNPDYLFKK